MKKSIIFLFMGIFISLASLSNAQQFWIENWTGTTAQGQTTYTTGPNGPWHVGPQSGHSENDSNVWYFSNMEEGMGRGICGAGGSGHATAHMGITTNSPDVWPIYSLLYTNPDQGAVIDDDANTATTLLLSSPTIICTGKSNITLSFNYIEGKAGHNSDYITVWYYNGVSWALLSTPGELDSCSSNSQGLWTYYSVALPASANNNANVKIGFQWTNGVLGYDDAVFNNTATPVVSFAVDSIILSTPPVPVASFTDDDSIPCIGDSVHFTDHSTNTPTSWKWYFQNGLPATSTLKNPAVKYTSAGFDSVKLVVKNAAGSDSITIKKCIHVKNCSLGMENITDNNGISLYPNPAKNTINMVFANGISGNAEIDITDITGRLISSQAVNASAGKTITMDISTMASGMYIMRITAGSNMYFEKFIRQ